MFRASLLMAAAALVLVTPVEAKTGALTFMPLEKLLCADVVVVGKVTALEKDTIDATPAPGAMDKLAYKIAVIKVESDLVGATNITHVKVGFIPPPPGDPAAPVRGAFRQGQLAQGSEGLFYLTKHHSGEFYVIHQMMAQVETQAEEYKDQLAQAKRAVAVLADPMGALKAERVADRVFAASVLILKYRTFPMSQTATTIGTQKVSADESKLILKALAERSWQFNPNDPDKLDLHQSFMRLNVTDTDGWSPPAVKPGEDFIDKTRDGFVAWLAGPGKDYRINKFVAKKK